MKMETGQIIGSTSNIIIELGHKAKHEVAVRNFFATNEDRKYFTDDEIERVCQIPEYVFPVIDNNKLIGLVWLNQEFTYRENENQPYQNYAQINLLIDKDSRNNKYGSNAFKLVLNYLFSDEIGFYRMFARADIFNNASKSVLMKGGFKQVGKPEGASLYFELTEENFLNAKQSW